MLILQPTSVRCVENDGIKQSKCVYDMELLSTNYNNNANLRQEVTFVHAQCAQIKTFNQNDEFVSIFFKLNKLKNNLFLQK